MHQLVTFYLKKKTLLKCLFTITLPEIPIVLLYVIGHISFSDLSLFPPPQKKKKKQRLSRSHSREGRSSFAAIRCRLRLQEHSEPGAEAETWKVSIPLCRSDGMSVRSEITPLSA